MRRIIGGVLVDSTVVLTSPFRPSRVRRAVLLLAVGVGLSGAVSACGQVDESETGARVLVTTDNGNRTLVDQKGIEITDGESVLKTVGRVAKVAVDAQTKQVSAIDGTAARGSAAWDFWVNGTQIRTGELPLDEDINLQQPETVVPPAEAKVYNGDTVWFDLRPDAEVASPRGVVGTFPEPFVHGVEGMRWPVRVECVNPRAQSCRIVRDGLVRFGIPAVTNLLRVSYNPETLRVAVGVWKDIREDPAAQLLERGVADSGVFARINRAGTSVQLLNDKGRAVETLGAGTGLVFASRYRDEPPSWVVTGTDEAGLIEAASVWDPEPLAKRLAVAVRGGKVTALPVTPARD